MSEQMVSPLPFLSAVASSRLVQSSRLFTLQQKAGAGGAVGQVAGQEPFCGEAA